MKCLELYEMNVEFPNTRSSVNELNHLLDDEFIHHFIQSQVDLITNRVGLIHWTTLDTWNFTLNWLQCHWGGPNYFKFVISKIWPILKLKLTSRKDFLSLIVSQLITKNENCLVWKELNRTATTTPAQRDWLQKMSDEVGWLPGFHNQKSIPMRLLQKPVEDNSLIPRNRQDLIHLIFDLFPSKEPFITELQNQFQMKLLKLGNLELHWNEMDHLMLVFDIIKPYIEDENAELVNRIKVMIVDLDNSRKANLLIRGLKPNQPYVDVTLKSYLYWPKPAKVTDITLPSSISLPLENYVNTYQNFVPNRTFNFQPEYSTIDVDVEIEGITQSVKLEWFGYMVLECFENLKDQGININQIQDLTMLDISTVVNQLNSLMKLKLVHYNFDTNLAFPGPSPDPSYYKTYKFIPSPKADDPILDRYSSDEIEKNEKYTKRYFNYIQMFLKSQGPTLTGEELYNKLKRFIIPSANFQLNREEFENFLVYLSLLKLPKLKQLNNHQFELV